MTFGLVARCDMGGLATITQEVYRHLCPDRTLLLNLGARGRGPCVEEAYDLGQAGQVFPASWDGGISDGIAEWIGGRGITTLFSAETFYDEKIVRAAKAEGVRTVMLAMPELAPWASTSPDRGRTLKPDVLAVPTTWRVETLPGCTVLPVPVARDRLPPTLRARAEHLFHMTGGAMLDRQGTELLLRAIPLISCACRLTIRSERPIAVPPSSVVEVDVISDRARNYWEAYPDGIDLLVAPRRYGGLSLPVQECASLGVPALVLQRDPYAQESFTFALDVTRGVPAHMKGADQHGPNPVMVWDASPHMLAQMIDEIVGRPDAVKAASAMANEWAEESAWDGPLRERWTEILDASAASLNWPQPVDSKPSAGAETEPVS